MASHLGTDLIHVLGEEPQDVQKHTTDQLYRWGLGLVWFVVAVVTVVRIFLLNDG